MTPDPTTVRALEALEARRCEASKAGDAAVLSELFAPGMLMVHFRGKMQSREDYIADVASKPRKIEIGPMTIQEFGDVAMMIGKHDITRYQPDGESRLIDAFATRLVRRSGDEWRYVFIQVSPSV